MTILVDTSVWIEFLKHNPLIFTNFRTLLEKGNILAVECIFGELLQGVKNDSERTIILGYWNNLQKIDEKGIWLEAGLYSSENNLHSKGVGLIDCVILVVSQKYKVKIWTLDKKLSSVLAEDKKYLPY